MQYIYENPQIHNQPLAEVMAHTYDAYHEVKAVAESQGLKNLALDIEERGTNAAERAGADYVDQLNPSSTSDPEMRADIDIIDARYQAVSKAAEGLGNQAILGSIDKTRSEDNLAVVRDYKRKLNLMLGRNTSELILANDEGNPIPAPEVVTEEEIVQSVIALGHSTGMAKKTWDALRHSSKVESMLVMPERAEESKRYNRSLLLVDSILKIVFADQSSATYAEDSDIKNALNFASPGVRKAVKDYANSVVVARRAQSK